MVLQNFYNEREDLHLLEIDRSKVSQILLNLLSFSV